MMGGGLESLVGELFAYSVCSSWYQSCVDQNTSKLDNRTKAAETPNSAIIIAPSSLPYRRTIPGAFLRTGLTLAQVAEPETRVHPKCADHPLNSRISRRARQLQFERTMSIDGGTTWQEHDIHTWEHSNVCETTRRTRRHWI